MARLIAFSAFCFALIAVPVQGNVGEVHKERSAAAKDSLRAMLQSGKKSHKRDVLEGGARDRSGSRDSDEMPEVPHKSKHATHKSDVEKDKLKQEIAHLERMVEKKHKKHHAKSAEIDWRAEEDTSEEEMRNQLHIGGGSKKKHTHHEKDTELEKESFNRVLEEQRMRKWEEEAKRRADAEGYSFLQWLIAIPVVIAVALGYLMSIGSDLRAVEIPGLGHVNLHKAAQDLMSFRSGGQGVKKVTHFGDSFDATPMQNPAQSGYGSYGSYGADTASFPVYQSYGNTPFGGSGESQGLFAAAPVAPPKGVAALSPDEDLGL